MGGVGLLRNFLARIRWRLTPGRAVRAILAVVIILAGGALVFHWTQHVGYFTALYWVITTVSTVGYGDVVPHSRAARIVAMVVMVVAVPVMGLLLADAASGLVEGRLRRILGMSTRSVPKDYMLVLGWTMPARIAVTDLLARGRHVLVIANVDGLGMDHPNLQFLHGDPADEANLERINPQDAHAAILCHDHDGDILIAALALHHMAPQLPITAVPSRSNTAQAMADLGLLASFPSNDLMGHVLARAAQAPHAGPLIWQLVRDEHHRIQEETPNAAEIGQTMEEVRSARALKGQLVFGVLNGDQVEFALSGQRLTADHRLIVLVPA